MKIDIHLFWELSLNRIEREREELHVYLVKIDFIVGLQVNVAGLSKATVAYKVYQTMFRVVKESETVDSRQHCFLLQSSGHEPRYLSVETRQELLRIENSWNTAIVTSVIKLGVSSSFFFVSYADGAKN